MKKNRLKNREKITVIIPTYNVKDIIRQCIKSALWADEILVVNGDKNGHSTDRTVEIAKNMGARILKHKYEYSAKQKNWAIPQAKYDWIFLLDSDEVITSELKNEILQLLTSKDLNNYDGFGIARPHYFLGKFLRWGGRYPLYNIRMFKKKCRYEDRDVHAHIILPKDKVKNLKGDLLHYSDPDLNHFFEKFNRYTTYQANYMLKVRQRGIKLEWKKFFTYYIYIKSVIKDVWYFLPFAPISRFVYMYFVRLGFLDGQHGFMIALLYAFQDYVSKTKYLELRQKQPRLRFAVQEFIKTFLPKKSFSIGISDRIAKEVT